MSLPRDELAQRLRLYVVTDATLARGRSDLEIVEAAISGGATAIQLRHKTAEDRARYEEAVALARYCRKRDVLFFVDDRVDIALASGADGVHLGQSDLPLPAARQIAESRLLIGISAETPQQARQAADGAADYIGAGTVFPTLTKSDAGTPIGIRGLAAITQAVDLPVVAIGGIQIQNIAQVVSTGVCGVAVVSAVVAAEKPEAAARALRDALDRALGNQFPSDR
ncbi:MAG: thiamine phosphate synthase [Firmicutes bacterium]|nr:thiamine phosphate synthase [Bacillota bacterium]